MDEMHTDQKASNEYAPKVARFLAAQADPSQFVPCLECGEPIAREKITAPRLLTHARCAPRFNARMKSEGHDVGMILKRAFRDVFHISRGFDYRGKDFRDDMEMLPDAVALLLAKTQTMHVSRLDAYTARDFENVKEAMTRGEHKNFLFSGCRGLTGVWHEKVS